MRRRLVKVLGDMVDIGQQSEGPSHALHIIESLWLAAFLPAMPLKEHWEQFKTSWRYIAEMKDGKEPSWLAKYS